jgi:signal transduction histidine kinase
VALRRFRAIVGRDAGVLAALAVAAIAAAIGALASTRPRLDPAAWSFDPFDRWPWWPGAPTEALALFVGTLLLLGVAAFLRRPRSGAAQGILAGSAANAAGAALAATTRPDELGVASASWAAFVASGSLSLILWSSLVHLVFVFPTRDRRLDDFPWALPVIYVAPQLALLVGAGAAGGLAPTSLDWLDGWSRVHASIVSVLLVVGISGIALRYRSVSAARRRQVGAIAASVTLTAAASLLLVDVPIMLGEPPIVPRTFVVLLGLPIPILLAVALWRDRGFRLDRLRRSRMALLHAREEERRRLRRDLHDGLGPTLAAIGLKVDAAASWVRTDPATAESLLRDVRANLTEAISETRRLVRGLRPPALDEQGLVNAIRGAAAEFSTGAGLPAITVAGEPLPTLPAAVEVAAYRIVHECMTNSVRHASAEHCDVRLEMRDGMLSIDVLDDGVGYDPRQPRGVGTEAMRERVEELGGEYRATSAPGEGTRVQVTLPVAHP